MPINAKLRDYIETKCCDYLEKRGFSRPSKTLVYLNLNADFNVWVGLNNAIYLDHVNINPYVGIHSTSIEKIRTSEILSGQKKKYSRGVATYSIHMGELCPHVPMFNFSEETDIDAEAERLASLYVDFGVPWAKSISNYENLLPLLKLRAPAFGGYPERVVSCLILMRNFDEARKYVDSFDEYTKMNINLKLMTDHFKENSSRAITYFELKLANMKDI